MRTTGCLALVLIAVAAMVGYNLWRMEQMRGEVRAIAGKLHLANNAGAKAGETASDLVTSLAEAEKHTRRAKELLKQGKAREAQTELDSALAKLKSANAVSSDMVGDAADFLGKARDNAVSVFQKTWDEISREARPKQ